MIKNDRSGHSSNIFVKSCSSIGRTDISFCAAAYLVSQFCLMQVSILRVAYFLFKVSLVRDTSFLAMLREMLILIRLWGQTTPGILPSITPSAGTVVRLLNDPNVILIQWKIWKNFVCV